MEWYFPESINSALRLLSKNYLIHGGGTGILMGGVKNIKGLISIEGLKLDYVRKEKNKIIIGSMSTFSDVIKSLVRLDENNILIKSLSIAASTPLRNRITIGGSIAFMPLWSDILGPLVALDSKIKILGYNKGTYSISEFIRRPNLKKNSLIKEISFNTGFTDSRYFSFKRTHFDFSIFNISFVFKKKNKDIENIRIALWGTKDKEKRLYGIEEILKEKKFIDEDILSRIFKPEFYPNIYFSKEYLEEISRIKMLSILKEIYEW